MKLNILLCCAGGFSTNMLMQSMKKVVHESVKLNDEDFSFEAIPVDSLESKSSDFDVVLVGPQIAHKEEFIKAILTPKNIPYAIIDKDIYGQMDGATVMKQALIAYKKNA